MSLSRKILLVLAATLIVIQFFPARKNEPAVPPARGIEEVFPVPTDVAGLLRISCYDCHSNSTRYPWYASIQPVGWWLSGHIEDGRNELNFEEFGSYELRRQERKFKEMEEMVTEDEMPLASYTFIHRDAALSSEQKSLLVAWTKAMRDSLAPSGNGE